jgi:3-dehydroquinate synthase
MTQDFKILDVELGARSYPIYIGSHLFDHAAIWALPSSSARAAFVLYDEAITVFAESVVKPALQKIHPKIFTCAVPSGESSKSMAQFESCCAWALSHQIQRNSIIYAVGGGVIGDIAGFVAASVLRGVDFVQIPTTILAQVDSAVGGKTGLNMPQGKNLIGAFYQPRLVLSDLAVLKTLPQREWKCGYAEILKYALLGDQNFFVWLEQNAAKFFTGDHGVMTHAIETSCRMKAAIVKADEREETGLRALLNLGHTFAHALEAAASYDGRLLHGEAVGIGLVLAARLSHELGFVGADVPDAICTHLKSCGMMTEISDITPKLLATADELVVLMQSDKKSHAEGINFIVLEKIGTAKTHFVSDFSIVKKVMTESLNHGA